MNWTGGEFRYIISSRLHSQQVARKVDIIFNVKLQLFKNDVDFC